jgi:hypothetical protein
MASTCSFRIKRGAGLPAGLVSEDQPCGPTDQRGSNDDVDLFGLGKEQSHFGIDEFLNVNTLIK